MLQVASCVHTIVQDTHDIDTVSHFSEIDDVTLYIAASVAQPDMIAGRRSVWRFGQFFKNGAQLVGVSVGLVDAPFLGRCSPNLFKVVLSGWRQAIFSHASVASAA